MPSSGARPTHILKEAPQRVADFGVVALLRVGSQHQVHVAPVCMQCGRVVVMHAIKQAQYESAVMWGSVEGVGNVHGLGCTE